VLIVINPNSILAQTEQDASDAKQLLDAGKNSLIARQMEQAIEELTKASSIYTDLGDSVNAYLCLAHLGEVYVYTGNNQKALDLTDSIMKFNGFEKSQELLYQTYQTRGMSQQRLRIGKVGLDNYLEAKTKLEAFGTEVNEDFLSKVYNGIGIAHAISSEYLKANAAFKLSAEKREKIGMRDLTLAATYNNLGNLAQLLGTTGRAIEYYGKSYDLHLAEVGDPSHPMFSYTYSGLHILYRELGLYEKSIEYGKKDLDIKNKVYDRLNPEFVITLMGLSASYREKEEFKNAKEVLDWALEITLKAFGPNAYQTSQVYIKLGQLNFDMRKLDLALEYYTRAEKNISASIETEEDIRLLEAGIGIGQTLCEMSLASEGLEKLRSLEKPVMNIYQGKGDFLTMLQSIMAEEYNKLEQYDSALLHYQRSFKSNLEDFNSDDIFEIPTKLNANKTKRFMSGIAGKAEALLKKYRAEGDSRYLITAAKTLELKDSIAPALHANSFNINDQLATQEVISKANQLAIIINHELYQIKADPIYLNSIFKAFEQNKSQLLLNRLRLASDKANLQLPDSLISQQKDLNSQIAYMESKLFNAEDEMKSYFQEQLFSTKRELEELRSTISSLYPTYSFWEPGNNEVSINELQSEYLETKEGLMHLHVTDSSLFRFLITKDEVLFEKVELDEAFFNALDDYLVQLQNPEQSSLEQFLKLNKIVSQRVLPSADKVLTLDKLTIIPDGQLNRLPFETLVLRESGIAKDFGSVEYLMKDVTVSYLLSTSFLKRDKPQPQVNDPKLLAVAPMTVNSGAFHISETRGSKELSQLIFSEREVELVSQHFHGKYYIGGAASEGQFKKDALDADIIHIASHSLIEVEEPIYSRILLAEPKDSLEDGMLFSREIIDMNLNCDMVVLSSCNSGHGKFIEGEGTISLASSFFYSGVRNVVMTLWLANDYSSSEIMRLFYEQLSMGHSKDDALRAAKTQYLSQADEITSHPYYWAHFVTNGQTNPVKSNASFNKYLVILAVLLFIGIIYQVIRKRRA